MKMSFDIEKLLKNMRPKPLTKDEKSALWLNIENAIARGMQTPARHGFGISGMPGRRFAYAAASLLIILGGSGATIAAANNAKPGDLLFPVDIAAEKVRLIFSTGEKKDELRIKFARERLKEAKIVVNVFMQDTQTANNSPGDATATSTPDNSMGTATSTNPTATTTPTNGDTGGQADESDNEPDPEDIEKARLALSVALEQLEETKSKLEETGNDAAVAAVNGIIEELTDLARNYVSNLDKFEAKIKDSDKKIKVEIRLSNDELKTKFKFEAKKEHEEQEKSKIEIKEKGSKTKIEIKTGGIKIEYKERVKEEKHEGDDVEENDDENGHYGEHEHNEDRDEDEDYEDGSYDDEDDKDGEDNKKMAICHRDDEEDEWETEKIKKRKLNKHLAHGDTLDSCEDQAPPPDTQAPTISGITATPDINSAAIQWSTDENTDSAAWHSTSTPVVIEGDTPKVSSSALTQTHELTLINLSASTTYYFIAVSTDEAGNTATSTESSFTTLPEPPPQDTTPPIVSSLMASGTTATSTAISWTTDENTTGKVWYDISTPLTVSTSTPSVENNSLTTSHLFTLTGLTASSTYYYMVSSADESGNTATSSEYSFTTL